MFRLVPTTGCPTIDAEVAVYADVVLRANTEEIVLLRYSAPFRSWYVCGCQSVEAAAGATIPEADLYWKRIGYVGDAAYLYAILDERPVRNPARWNATYDNIAYSKILEPLRCPQG
jgi:hypothetical protein